MNTMTLKEFQEEAARRFGDDPLKWQVICPKCKTAQTPQDFLDTGMADTAVSCKFGFSCIGRYSDKKGCDWTLGGLFHIHTLEVDGRPSFEIAGEVAA